MYLGFKNNVTLLMTLSCNFLNLLHIFIYVRYFRVISFFSMFLYQGLIIHVSSILFDIPHFFLTRFTSLSCYNISYNRVTIHLIFICWSMIVYIIDYHYQLNLIFINKCIQRKITHHLKKYALNQK